jgi:DNA (cytosine-5)-methyltransferase 1
MMLDGVVYELPTQAHRTTDSESLSLPTLRTPSVTDATGGAISESQAIERGRMVKVADQMAELAFDNGLKVSPSISASLLPTPTVGHVRNHDEPVEDYLERRQDFLDGKTKGMPGASLGVAVRMEMLPTVTTQDAKNNAGESQFERNTLPLNAEVMLLPTVQVDDAKNTGHNQDRRATLASKIWLAENTTNWGKFEPAIRRWEELTRPAPAPTKPDGKDDAHRLSAEFTEWMMGLPQGWVTAEDIGLKRNDQLKACGNGVVPQQAEMALKILLQDINI